MNAFNPDVGSVIYVPNSKGIGTIVSRETQTMGGMDIDCYQVPLKYAADGKTTTIYIPAHKLSKSVLPVASKEELLKALVIAASPAKTSTVMWKVKADAYQGYMKTGNLEDIAVIYRDTVHADKHESDINYSERQIRNEALNILAMHLAVAIDIDIVKAAAIFQSAAKKEIPVAELEEMLGTGQMDFSRFSARGLKLKASRTNRAANTNNGPSRARRSVPLVEFIPPAFRINPNYVDLEKRGMKGFYNETVKLLKKDQEQLSLFVFNYFYDDVHRGPALDAYKREKGMTDEGMEIAINLTKEALIKKSEKADRFFNPKSRKRISTKPAKPVEPYLQIDESKIDFDRDGARDVFEAAKNIFSPKALALFTFSFLYNAEAKAEALATYQQKQGTNEKSIILATDRVAGIYKRNSEFAAPEGFFPARETKAGIQKSARNPAFRIDPDKIDFDRPHVREVYEAAQDALMSRPKLLSILTFAFLYKPEEREAPLAAYQSAANMPDTKFQAIIRRAITYFERKSNYKAPEGFFPPKEVKIKEPKPPKDPAFPVDPDKIDFDREHVREVYEGMKDYLSLNSMAAVAFTFLYKPEESKIALQSYQEKTGISDTGLTALIQRSITLLKLRFGYEAPEGFFPAKAPKIKAPKIRVPRPPKIERPPEFPIDLEKMDFDRPAVREVFESARQIFKPKSLALLAFATLYKPEEREAALKFYQEKTEVNDKALNATIQRTITTFHRDSDYAAPEGFFPARTLNAKEPQFPIDLDKMDLERPHVIAVFEAAKKIFTPKMLAVFSYAVLYKPAESATACEDYKRKANMEERRWQAGVQSAITKFKKNGDYQAPEDFFPAKVKKEPKAKALREPKFPINMGLIDFDREHVDRLFDLAQKYLQQKTCAVFTYALLYKKDQKEAALKTYQDKTGISAEKLHRLIRHTTRTLTKKSGVTISKELFPDFMTQSTERRPADKNFEIDRAKVDFTIPGADLLIASCENLPAKEQANAFLLVSQKLYFPQFRQEALDKYIALVTNRTAQLLAKKSKHDLGTSFNAATIATDTDISLSEAFNRNMIGAGTKNLLLGSTTDHPMPLKGKDMGPLMIDGAEVVLRTVMDAYNFASHHDLTSIFCVSETEARIIHDEIRTAARPFLNREVA